MKKITVTLPDKAYDVLKAISITDDISMSAILLKALKNWVIDTNPYMFDRQEWQKD